MSKQLINLAFIKLMYDNGDGEVAYEINSGTGTIHEIGNAKDMTVYGEGEMIVSRWLRELAGEEEAED